MRSATLTWPMSSGSWAGSASCMCAWARARGSGPRERMVPLINGAGVTLRWFIEDVWYCFDDDHVRPGAPLFCSERRNADGTAARVGNETLRSSLTTAAAVH